MTLIVERVGAALEGLRIDRAVALVADVSRSSAARLLREGAVRLDGDVVASGARRVSAGQVLSLDFEVSEDAAPSPDPEIVFETVFEDPDVVVVDKPADLVVHPGAGRRRGTLVNGLLARYPEIAGVGDTHRPGIVHRLDRATSGLLVVARTERAHRSLTHQMRLRQAERIYSCLVWGHPDAAAGLIDAPVGRSRRNPMRMTVTERGRAAQTGYEVEARYHEPSTVALLACRLHTGRTHQIRVHLEAVGHPVVGDPTYGGGRRGHRSSTDGAVNPGRPFLHARSLTFVHPVTGATVRAEAPLPRDLAAVLASLS